MRESIICKLLQWKTFSPHSTEVNEWEKITRLQTQELPGTMDQHRHTGMEAHFSGTSTTIPADTQHALILNYVDTKPCNARESLPYRQEQHPRLSSQRTSLGITPATEIYRPYFYSTTLGKGSRGRFGRFSLFLESSFLYSFRSIQNRLVLSLFFSVALVDPSSSWWEKKDSCSFFESRPCLRFLPLHVRQKMVWKNISQNRFGPVFINLIFNSNVSYFI